MGHQVSCRSPAARSTSPWEQVFYAEFDGQRKKTRIAKLWVQGVPESPSSASAVVLVDGRVVLVGDHEPLKGSGNLPGGGAGARRDAGGAREVLEETD